MEFPQNTRHTLPHNPAILLLNLSENEIKIERYMHANIYSSTVYNSQDMEATCIPQQTNSRQTRHGIR